MMNSSETLRIDKWLWCARFFKTRSLAADEIAKNRVSVNGQTVKASREVRLGDMVALRQGPVPRTVRVLGIRATRGPAPIAQQMYEETAESLLAREQVAEQRRLAPEPAASLQEGRPTKRDRRNLEQVRDWGDRWSASIEG